MMIALSFSSCTSPDTATDNALIARGFPQSVIKAMNHEVKENIYSYGDSFDFATLQYENTNQTTSYEFTSENQAVLPEDKKPASRLSLTWLVTRTQGGKRITFNYDWTKLPVNRLQDPISVSWDPNMYELRGGSFHKVDRYVYHVGASPTAYTGTQSDQWAFAKVSPSGVLWYADLKGHSNVMPVTNLYGYGEFILDQKTSGGSNIYANYEHKKVGISFSTSVTDFSNPAISANSTAGQHQSKQYISP